MTTTAKKTIRKTVSKPRTKDATVQALDEVLIQLHDKRKTAKDLAEDISSLQDQAMPLLDQLGETKHVTTLPDGTKVRATKVEGHRTVIDEAKLKRKIGLSMWNKVTSRFLDRKKLDAYIASGEIKASIVADCTDEAPNKPYVKVM